MGGWSSVCSAGASVHAPFCPISSLCDLRFCKIATKIKRDQINGIILTKKGAGKTRIK